MSRGILELYTILDRANDEIGEYYNPEMGWYSGRADSSYDLAKDETFGDDIEENQESWNHYSGALSYLSSKLKRRLTPGEVTLLSLSMRYGKTPSITQRELKSIMSEILTSSGTGIVDPQYILDRLLVMAETTTDPILRGLSSEPNERGEIDQDSISDMQIALHGHGEEDVNDFLKRMGQFESFIGRLRTKGNGSLIESILEGYRAIYRC